MMMGIPENERPSVNEKEQLIPFENHGVKVISIGFLVDPGKAIIWRGPMLHGVIKQFLTSVAWGELDYLIVDSASRNRRCAAQSRTDGAAFRRGVIVTTAAAGGTLGCSTVHCHVY